MIPVWWWCIFNTRVWLQLIAYSKRSCSFWSNVRNIVIFIASGSVNSITLVQQVVKISKPYRRRIDFSMENCLGGGLKSQCSWVGKLIKLINSIYVLIQLITCVLRSLGIFSQYKTCQKLKQSKWQLGSGRQTRGKSSWIVQVVSKHRGILSQSAVARSPRSFASTMSLIKIPNRNKCMIRQPTTLWRVPVRATMGQYLLMVRRELEKHGQW